MESKGVTRRPPLAVVGRPVNRADRVGQRHKPAVGSNRIGNGVIKFGEDVENDAERPGDLPRRDRARGGINRNRCLRPQFGNLVRDVLVFIEQFVVGVCQLALTSELADLARKDSAHAAAQSVCPPRLVEERQRQRPRPVRNHDFEKRALSSVHRSIVDPNDLGDNRDRLVEGKRIERSELAAFGVTPWVMPEQPADGVEPEGLGQCLRRAVADNPCKRGVEERGGFGHGFTLPPHRRAFGDWRSGR